MTKSDLNELRYLKKKIEGKEAELEELYLMLQGTSSPIYSDEPRGGKKIDVLTLYDKVISNHKKLDKLKKEYLDKREIVYKKICRLDEKSYRIIYLRYFENHTWCNIAEKLSYSLQHLHRLHSRSLNKLKKH